MVDVSSLGRAQPKTKTINVQANLLAERLGERGRLLDAMSRKAFWGVGILVFALMVLPSAFRIQERLSAQAAKLSSEAALLQRQVSDKQALLDTAKPAVEDSKMITDTRLFAGNLLAQLSVVFNAADGEMVFSSIKVETLGGEMKLSGRADAKSYHAARDFVDRISKAQGTKSASLKQWRLNDQFGANGVSFEIERTAEVGR